MGMDVYGKQPKDETGKYFRANVWSWRPIHALCEIVLNQLLPWGSNDGEGFKTQSECDRLANALEKYLNAFPKERIELESTCRVDARGKFLKKGSTGGFTAYSTDQEHVRDFIRFLRACGGFEIL